MIEFECTQEDLGNLGYPMDMKKEMFRNYHQWITVDKGNPLEFKCTIERSLDYCNAFIEGNTIG